MKIRWIHFLFLDLHHKTQIQQNLRGNFARFILSSRAPRATFVSVATGREPHVQDNITLHPSGFPRIRRDSRYPRTACGTFPRPTPARQGAPCQLPVLNCIVFAARCERRFVRRRILPTLFIIAKVGAV